MARGTTGLRLGDCLWEASLRFHCQWLHFDEVQRLWTGGYRRVLVCCSKRRLGCLPRRRHRRLRGESGAQHVSVALPEETAWGYGADPIVLAADCRGLYVLGRDASLHVIDTTTCATHRLYNALDELDGVTTPSLGIGHAALHDGWLYAGFSRGGFRLLRYAPRQA